MLSGRSSFVFGTDRQRYVGEGMGSGLNRGFVPCRGSNQWDIETKAGIGISFAFRREIAVLRRPIDAKIQQRQVQALIGLVLLALRF